MISGKSMFSFMNFCKNSFLLLLMAFFWGCKSTDPEKKVEKPPSPPKSDSARIILYNGLYYQEGTTLPFTGTQISYWPNGLKMSHASYLSGKKNGQESRWFHNGRPYYEYHYLHGKLHGSKREWNIGGKLLLSEVWNNGRLAEKKP